MQGRVPLAEIMPGIGNGFFILQAKDRKGKKFILKEKGWKWLRSN
jgi:hypothetical protein